MVVWQKVECRVCGTAELLKKSAAFLATNGWVYPAGADPTKDEPYHGCPSCRCTGWVEQPVVVPETTIELTIDPEQYLDF